jgi:hypothetical protein
MIATENPVCVGTEPEVQPESNQDLDFDELALTMMLEARDEVEDGQEQFWGQEVAAPTAGAVDAPAS